MVYLLLFFIWIGFLIWINCLGVFSFLILVDWSKNMNGLVFLFIIGSLLLFILIIILLIFKFVSVDVKCFIVWIVILFLLFRYVYSMVLFIVFVCEGMLICGLRLICLNMIFVFVGVGWRVIVIFFFLWSLILVFCIDCLIVCCLIICLSFYLLKKVGVNYSELLFIC